MGLSATRVRYTAALAILAVLSIAQFAVLASQTRDEARRSDGLARAAAQAELVERIAAWAAEDVAPPAATPRARVRAGLRRDVDALVRNARRDALEPRPPGDPPARTARYAEHAQALLAVARPRRSNPDYRFLAGNRDALVTAYHDVANVYAADAARSRGILEAEAAAALAVVLLALLAEGIFIFGPMERAIVRQRDALLAQVSQLRSSEQRLSHRASHDALTGLLNRGMLYDVLSAALARAEAQGDVVGVLFIDLDDVKSVNDGLGHDLGDRLIVAAAARLREALHPKVPIVRTGGDEFVAIVEAAQPGPVVAAALAVRERLRSPLQLGTATFRPTAGIGVAIYPEDGRDAETLVRNADAAMYEAKRAREDRPSLYRPQVRKRLADRAHRAAELRDAIAADALELLFQPIVDRTFSIVAAEALVRWHHPRIGPLAPETFIPLAEETGAVRELDAWVLARTCAALGRWRAGGVPAVQMRVNVSGRTLDRGFADALRGMLARYELDAAAVGIEITETALLHDFASAATTIAELREMGIFVAIDDFGTGYNSLAYLKRLRVDALKIDRSFVREIAKDACDAAIVASVLTLAKKLDLLTVAEGVETVEIAQTLLELGCERFQGHLFGHPIAEADVPAVLATQGPGIALEEA